MSRTLEQLARKIIFGIREAIFEQEAGALKGDIEAIHDMRVAIRKFRVALNNFAVILSKEDRRRLRGHLERLALALGKVRDLDVMIDSIKPALSISSPEKKSAIKALTLRLQMRRRRQLKSLQKYLHGEDYTNFKTMAGALELNTTKALTEKDERGQAA